MTSQNTSDSTDEWISKLLLELWPPAAVGVINPKGETELRDVNADKRDRAKQAIKSELERAKKEARIAELKMVDPIASHKLSASVSGRINKLAAAINQEKEDTK